MEDVRDTFERHGLRSTKQRLSVYRALLATRSHPTADELHQMVCASDEHLSLATVYNTLEALSDAGLCRKLPTTSGSVRYDADVSDHLHIRLRDSGRIVDVPPALGDRLLAGLATDVIREIESETGVRIEGMQVQLLGVATAAQ